MNVWPAGESRAPVLCGSEGELVSVCISIEPRLLEDLLEALAQVEFPINPQIYHQPQTRVEFPAWSGRLGEVERCLRSAGLDHLDMDVQSMLHQIYTQ